MSKMKRVLGAAVAVVMMLCVVGCSTPKVAISVGDRDYSTGEYLAYLYSTASTIYNYYANYADTTTMWEQELPYSNPYARQDETSDEAETGDSSDTSEAEDDTKVTTAEYIRQAAKDNIIYMAAIESLMKDYGITLSDEDKAAAESDLANYTDSQLRELGCSLENYKKMWIANNYNEDALLMGLYGKGGKKEIAEKELRAYFDENYLTYEIIQIALVDSEGNALSEDEEAKVRARIDKYMGVYQSTGDFDKAIEAYDNESDEESTTETTTTTDTAVENVTSNTSDNVMEVDATQEDENLVKAIRSVDEGDVKIVEYKQDGTSQMVALIYRIDPDGKGRENRFTELNETLIHTIKADEFKNLVWDKMDAQAESVVINERAIKMCKPENFFED